MYIEHMADAEMALAQQNLLHEAEYKLDLLKDEVLSDATMVNGSTWGNLKGSVMKSDYEFSLEFQGLEKEDKRLMEKLIQA